MLHYHERLALGRVARDESRRDACILERNRKEICRLFEHGGVAEEREWSWEKGRLWFVVVCCPKGKSDVLRERDAEVRVEPA